MAYSNQLKSIRSRFRNTLRGTPGIQGISITKDECGNLALAARVHDNYFDDVNLPRRFENLAVIKKRSSDFRPQ